MPLLDSGYAAELRSQLGEALLISGLGKSIVHVGPLVVLTLCGGGQVLGGGADALQLLEPKLCMLLLECDGAFALYLSRLLPTDCKVNI